MKKLFSLILCIVFVCLTLVSCKQEVIGEYLENYKSDENTDDSIEKLNFYIITGDGTSEDAKITVPQNINAYLKEKYRLQLVIHYFTEEEYQSNVMTAMEAETEGDRPDIILINSAGMFDALKNRLVPLNTSDFNFYAGDYRALNTIVKPALLKASAENGVYYTVPNNHNIGNYEYVVFDQVMAQKLGYRIANDFDNPNKLVASVNTAEAVENFKQALREYDSSLNVDDYIKVVSAGYEGFEILKRENLATGEASVVAVNHVNIMAYPNATKEEAHLSAFAIVKQLDDDGSYETEEELANLKNHYNKCMKIIYALNTDATLKNLLQYGFVGTNYSHVLDEKNEPTNVVKLVEDVRYRYEMNHIHTGDSFNSGFYFCNDDKLGWDKTTQANWLKQIADARMPEEKITTEWNDVVSNLELTTDGLEVSCDASITVPTHGSYYSDVDIAWTTENANVFIDSTNGTITFANVSEQTVAEIKVELTCLDITIVKTFQVTINKTEG